MNRAKRVIAAAAAILSTSTLVARWAGADDEPAAESGTTVSSPSVDEDEHTTHTPISQSTDYDEVVVTAAPHSRRRFDVVQGTAVLSQEELERALQTTVGETLAELPGVSSTYYGPGSSRPVVRGLDGPRVRVLTNDLGTLDASVTSPDHAVVAEPMTTQRVEILRGAGTLLYGGNAIGGVVNIYDGRIPTELPGDTVEGDVRVLYGSAAEEKSAGAGLTTALGPVAFRAAGYFRDTNQLSIPGFAPSDALLALRPDIPTGPYGTALNTDVDDKGGTLGTSFVGDRGHLGVSYGVVDKNYGVPAEIGEEIRIDLYQQRVDVNGAWKGEMPLLDQAELKLGWADYNHTELEGLETGTQFFNEGWEGRLDLVQKPWRDLHGTVGFQFGLRDFRAVGEEAFVPPNDTFAWGLFGVEEYHLGDVTLEAGLRFDQTNTKAAPFQFPPLNATLLQYDRRWNAVSFSLGAGWEFLTDYLVGLSLSRTERAPSPEELLSFGPHLATLGFDVGDPFLDKEAGLTVEGTLRKRRGRWSGGVNLFWTRFSGFIYQQNLGFVDDTGNPDPMGELMLRRYLQNDADFVGGEVQGAVEAIQTERFTGVLDLALDWVKGTARTSLSERLPRIPPLRLKGGVEGRSQYADLRFEVWWVAAQNRTAWYELPTDSYVMLNLVFTAHPFPDRRNVTLVVQGRNLSDAEARVHASFLKDRLPLAGREARVGLKVAF